jgi:hypothetical protein
VLQDIHLASSDSIIELAAIMGRIGCRRVAHMWDSNLQSWKDLNYKLERVRGLTTESLSFARRFLCQVEQAKMEDHPTSTTAGHWRWSDKDQEDLETFTLHNRHVYLFLLPQEFNHHQLNSIWEVALEEGEWRAFWQALWQSDLTTKAKVFVWRVLAQGLFTGSRAITIRIGDGCCSECPGTVETIPHLFASCPYAKSIWKLCWPLLYGRNLSSNISPNLFKMIQEQLRKQSASTARLFLLYQSIWHLWLGRNAKLFNDEP